MDFIHFQTENGCTAFSVNLLKVGGESGEAHMRETDEKDVTIFV